MHYDNECPHKDREVRVCVSACMSVHVCACMCSVMDLNTMCPTLLVKVLLFPHFPSLSLPLSLPLPRSPTHTIDMLADDPANVCSLSKEQR